MWTVSTLVISLPADALCCYTLTISLQIIWDTVSFFHDRDINDLRDPPFHLSEYADGNVDQRTQLQKRHLLRKLALMEIWIRIAAGNGYILLHCWRTVGLDNIIVVWSYVVWMSIRLCGLFTWGLKNIYYISVCNLMLMYVYRRTYIYIYICKLR